jgi:hypothetical protein
MDEQVATHVLEDALWSIIRKRRPLDERYRDHIRECRDCREFVREVASEAEGQGFTIDESFHTA